MKKARGRLLKTMHSIFLSSFVEKMSYIKQNMLLIFMTLALLRDITGNSTFRQDFKEVRAELENVNLAFSSLSIV